MIAYLHLMSDAQSVMVVVRDVLYVVSVMGVALAAYAALFLKNGRIHELVPDAR